MIIATAKAMRPRSSAAAKPMNRRPCWPSAAAGLRSALSRNEPNTLPTPRAAMPTPIAARPAPRSLAAFASMVNYSLCFLRQVLVKVDRVVEIKARQQREDVGLDRGDQQLEGADPDHQDEARQADHRGDPQGLGVEAVDDEAGQHLQQDVP